MFVYRLLGVTSNVPPKSMPTLGISGTVSTVCRPTFLLKNVHLGSAHCLKIHRSHHTLNGSNEEGRMISWFECDHSNMELHWTMLPMLGLTFSTPIHICQFIRGTGMECIAMTNLKLEQYVVDETVTYKIHSKPFSESDKTQAWERERGPRVLNGFQLMNFGHQVCLGSNFDTLNPLEHVERSQLFAEGRCDNSLKIRWYMEQVLDTDGKPKCTKEN